MHIYVYIYTRHSMFHHLPFHGIIYSIYLLLTQSAMLKPKDFIQDSINIPHVFMNLSPLILRFPIPTCKWPLQGITSATPVKGSKHSTKTLKFPRRRETSVKRYPVRLMPSGGTTIFWSETQPISPISPLDVLTSIILLSRDALMSICVCKVQTMVQHWIIGKHWITDVYV